MVGEAGMSPYEIVFGRERNLSGIPFRSHRCSEAAHSFMDRMQNLESKNALALNEKHAKTARQINTFRKDRVDYVVGQSVRVVRQKSVGDANRRVVDGTSPSSLPVGGV